jgi:hypothetical protein
LRFRRSHTERINISISPPTSSPFNASNTIAATMSQSAKKNAKEEADLLSAQPTGVNKHTGLGPLVTRATIGTGPPRGSGTATPSTPSTGEKILAAHLDITPSLQKATHSVVKARNGNVLSRGSILKTDHYPSGECFKLWGSGGVGGTLSGCCRCATIKDNSTLEFSIHEDILRSSIDHHNSIQDEHSTLI